MKNKIVAVIGTISFFLLIGTVGGYEQDLITTSRFLLQFGILILILIGCIKLGGSYENWKS